MDYLKLIRAILLMLLFGSELMAQSHQIHHSKYWFYRYRMRNEFMVRKYGAPICGTPSGYMIPASGAYKGDEEDLHFGDGTSMVGTYLAVLTTEYELLKKGNTNYTQAQLNDVLQEIYWALKAYERLDRNAEVLFPPFLRTCSDGLNGFFVRDDVPKTMAIEMPARPNGIPKKIGTSDYHRGHTATIDDVTVDESGDDPEDEKAIFPSADQITNLLTGFAFVKKKLNGVFWNGENLGMLANDYTDKIVSYTQNWGYDMRVPYDWRHTAYAGYFNFGRFGYGIAKAGNRIFKSSWGSEAVTAGSFDVGLEYKHSFFWNCLNYPSGTLEYERNYTNSAYNNAIYSQLAAVGSSWEYGLLPEKCAEYYVPLPCNGTETKCKTACAWCFNWGWAGDCNCRTVCVTYPTIISWTACGYGVKLWHYVVNMPLCANLPPIATPFGWCIYPVALPKFSYNTTALALSEYGHQTNTQIFAMEHKYLHNQGAYTYGTSRIWDYLATAPCGGPHKYPFNDPHNSSDSYGAYGWHVDNRWEKSNPQSYENDSHHEGWNGLDYMLLHNLYYLLHGNSNDMKTFRNEMDYVMNSEIWPNSSNEGSKNTPKEINGFETITASNSFVYSTGDLTLHAGKNVKLSGGFKVKEGGNFKAYSQYTFNYCDLSVPYIPNDGHDNFRLGGGTYEEEANGVVEPINDSTRVMSTIIQGFNNKLDSASSLLEKIRRDNRYVPLNEFVATATQKLNIPPSQILSLTPNPSTGTFVTTFYLAEPERVSFYLVSPTGVKTLLLAESQYPKGRQNLSFSTQVAPNNYSVLMQGENINSTKNLIIQ